MRLEEFMVFGGLVEVDFGLGAWFDEERSRGVGAYAFAM
jgi:hypothetical protein